MDSQPQEAHFEGIHCKLSILRPAPAVFLIRISGSDVGEFGTDPLRLINEWAPHGSKFELFIDAREGRGVSVDVSAEWAQWLASRRADLRCVTMISGSPFIHLTADFVRRIAALEDVMRICTDPAAFDRALAEAVPGT